jgi:HlyD family secretion protein
MKRMLLTAILAVALPSLLAACSAGGQAQAPTAVPPIETSNAVIAEAKVMPGLRAALSFRAGGTVADVLVQEGDAVAAGQVIARLDRDTKAVELARAEAQLKAAEARLQDLADGPRQEDIDTAEAQLRQAQAQLKQVVEGVTPEDLASAQAQLDAAQAALARLRPGAGSADVRASQAQLDQAQAGLATQRDQLSATKTNAELQLSQAADQLMQAQTAYSAARWNWEHVQAHGTDPINPSVPDSSKPGQNKANKLNDTQKQQYHDAFVQAERNLHSAELAVQQAQVVVENARQAEINGMRAAEATVASSQASLESTRSSVLSEQLAQAKAQLAQARAALARLRGPQRDNQIAVAQAGVEAAQASLASLTAPPQPSELTTLEAQVESAKADRDAARLALAQIDLKAPFAGLVASLDLRAGEAIEPNAPVVQLAGTATWQIETTDLTELDVARVHAGDRVALTFDALPGVELAGHVLRVKDLGENHQGDIVYRAIIVPEQADARLRWNMTAAATISPDGAAAESPRPPR